MKQDYNYTDEEFNALFNDKDIYESIVDFLIEKNFHLVQGSHLQWCKRNVTVYLDEPNLIVHYIKGEFHSKEFDTPFELYNYLTQIYK